MTGRSRFTAEELARMDDYAEKAAKLAPDQLAQLGAKYRTGNHPHKDEILDALYTALSGR